MSLLTAAEQRRRNTLRRLLLAVGALMLAVTGTVVVTLLVIDGYPRSAPTPPPGPENISSRHEPETRQSTMPPVSAGPLILPRPTHTTRGVPTGFPPSTEGAIAAAAQYTQVAVGLDAQRAQQLAAVAVTPSYPHAAAEFAQAVRSARASLGLSNDGPTRGAYLSFAAKQYRVLNAKPERTVVAVLGTVDGAGPATQGQGRTSHAATAYVMCWVDGDWRIGGAGPALPDRLPMPRSSQAYVKGWRDLAMG